MTIASERLPERLPRLVHATPRRASLSVLLDRQDVFSWLMMALPIAFLAALGGRKKRLRGRPQRTLRCEALQLTQNCGKNIPQDKNTNTEPDLDRDTHSFHKADSAGTMNPLI